ncbi:MAG TPA: SagB/ThcOx family dehydrogenase [Roseiarcus sp.]|jgi:nitroreductase
MTQRDPQGAALRLPPPRKTGGMPLFEAIARRRSAREFSERPLPEQTLSDLLWAAFGVNGPEGARTAPYALHIVMLDLYVATADGVWLYDAASHTLLPHAKEDIRAATGEQDFVGHAGLDLVYVGHAERMSDLPMEQRRLNACVDAGFIGENVYLFCASEGLATVFLGAVDAAKLAQALKLPDDQFVAYVQTVGFPA